jgi:hypothetical protein
MSTTSASDSAHSAMKSKSRPSREGVGAGQSRTPWSQLTTTTVSVAGLGKVAFTRPGMPRLFRFLLALTGVRV